MKGKQRGFRARLLSLSRPTAAACRRQIEKAGFHAHAGYVCVHQWAIEAGARARACAGIPGIGCHERCQCSH